jgi:hypothetical protein
MSIITGDQVTIVIHFADHTPNPMDLLLYHLKIFETNGDLAHDFNLNKKVFTYDVEDTGFDYGTLIDGLAGWKYSPAQAWDRYPSAWKYSDAGISWDLTPPDGVIIPGCGTVMRTTYTIEFNDQDMMMYWFPEMNGTFDLIYRGLNSYGAPIWSAPIGGSGAGYHWCMYLGTSGYVAIFLDDNPLCENFTLELYNANLDFIVPCSGACNPLSTVSGWTDYAIIRTPGPLCLPITCGSCSPALSESYSITVSGLIDWSYGNGSWELFHGYPLVYQQYGTACIWVSYGGPSTGPNAGAGNWSMAYNSGASRWELSTDGVLGFYKSGTECDGPTGVWVNAGILETGGSPTCIVS